MENQDLGPKKVICYYCGTIYESTEQKCPLCGGTVTTDVSEDDSTAEVTAAEKAEVEAPPVEETPYASTEEEAEEDWDEDEEDEEDEPTSKKKKKKKKASRIPTGLLFGIVIFLFLAVLVVGYFILDMLGYLPGPEDNIQRNYGEVGEHLKCTKLVLDNIELTFSAPGEVQTLKVSVNAGCNEEVVCRITNRNVVNVSHAAQSEVTDDLISTTFNIEAVSSGTAELVFSCGGLNEVCTITCQEPVVDVPPIPAFEPELNLSNVVLTEENAKMILRVKNLPEGATPFYKSSDEDVVTVTEQGVVSAIGEGSATITVDIDGNEATMEVTVDFSRGVIGLDDVSFELDVDKYFRLFLLDENGYSITNGVTFEVEDPSVCKIDGERVYGLVKGITQIIATYEDVQYVCVVQVV